uniref:Uncharacterized protein n=1 Tax=Rhizophora mucronata TaxID=61149 RepID=A0A2P2K6V7_RHIMU
MSKVLKIYRKSLTFPKASKPLSKKSSTPRNEKKMPKPIRPNPIFFCSFSS